VAERGMVHVNGDKIRDEARRQLDETRDRLEQARRQVDHFEQRDLQAYEAWMQAELAPRIAELRKVALEGNRQLERVLMLEEEIFATGLDAETCLKRVDRRLQQEADKKAGKTDGEAYDEDDDLDDEFDDELDEEIEAAFDDLFGPSGEDDDFEPPPPKNKKPPAHKLDKDSKGELKRLYRELVRRCHPDRTGRHDPAALALWHEVQDAYLAQDLGRLAMLHESSANGETVVSTTTPVGRMLDMVKSMLKSLREAQALVAKAKRHPAWNFLQWEDLRRRRERDKLHRELNREEEALRENNRRYDFALQALLREYPARRGGSGRSNRGRGR
jgi:hypothetical protein